MSTSIPPVFSILTSHLNQGYFLGEALVSAFTQEGSFYIEHILVDAGSTDSTDQVLMQIEKTLKDSGTATENRGQVYYAPSADQAVEPEVRIRCLGVNFKRLTIPGITRAAGLNRALSLASGDIIAILDGDDTFADRFCLASVAAYFAAHPEAAFLYGNRRRVDYSGITLLEREDIDGYTAADLKDIWFVMPQAAFWRHDVHKAVGDFDESYNFICTWDFFLRCAGHYALHKLNEVLGVKRLYPESRSGNPLNRFKRCKEILRFLIKNDALTERAVGYYVIPSHPSFIEQSQQLRARDEWIRSLLVEANYLNRVIRFGLYGNSKPFEESGWSAPEGGFTWTDGEQATMVIPIGPTSAEELILRARLRPFVKPGFLDCRTIDIAANNVPVGQWKLTIPEYQDQSARIPRKLYENASSLRLAFFIRDAVSAASVGEGSEQRHLGFALLALRIDEINTESGGVPSPPTLFHITHQKAGSQWILAVLQELVPERIIQPKTLNMQFFEDFISEGGVYPTLYITRDEFDRLDIPSNHRKLIVIRDLRDTLVSYYFSLKHSHRILDAWGAEMRRRLSQLPVDDGLLDLMNAGPVDHMAKIQLSWLGAEALFIRYEDLWQNEVACFNRIFRHFELETDEHRKLEAIRNNAFEQKSGGRARGESNVSHHLRQGLPGDWRHVFSDNIKAVFKEKYGDVLIQTGYERSLDW